jgi:hypothetical protein
VKNKNLLFNLKNQFYEIEINFVGDFGVVGYECLYDAGWSCRNAGQRWSL